MDAKTKAIEQQSAALAKFRRAAVELAKGVVERAPDMAGSLLTAASRVLELESNL